ncbi:ATP-binding protein [Streptomyces sp. NPDC017936]|uniref:sensor histidine kinase n=1 Tax=Streptomyces sp. NPDC017936 TaxID=3365016 RepID=UPI0037B62E08
MSHLRAPAARADRREGGRHGRPVARTAPAPAETHIGPQLLRLAVLPPTAVALSACAAVLFAVRSTGVRPGPTLWAVLAGALGVTTAGIVIAAVAAGRAARSVSDRVEALRRSSARGEADLRALLDTLRRGEVPARRAPHGGPPAGADAFELLAADLSRAHDGAVTAVVQAARLSSQAGSEQKLEVFVNLARRLQSLVHREISILDELENEIEDPDLLKGLFHVDHLATRIRRHAENLAVLGGAVSRRQWSNPVPVTEVLRSAIAEVEQYSRVRLVPPVDGELRGHAVADVVHLLAELVENATVFSAPHTQVLLRADLVTSGLAVEVEDRGLGMPVEEQSRVNALLADPDQVNVGLLLADGRIGLYVVSQLARRHGIRVRLQTNIYGGVQAVLVVPQALLGPAAGVPVPQPEESGGGEAPAGADAREHAPRATGSRGPAPVPPAGRTPALAPAPAPLPVPVPAPVPAQVRPQGQVQPQTPVPGQARTPLPRPSDAGAAGTGPSGAPVTGGERPGADAAPVRSTPADGGTPSPARRRDASGGERPPLAPQPVPPAPHAVPPAPQAALPPSRVVSPARQAVSPAPQAGYPASQAVPGRLAGPPSSQAVSSVAPGPGDPAGSPATRVGLPASQAVPGRLAGPPSSQAVSSVAPGPGDPAGSPAPLVTPPAQGTPRGYGGGPAPLPVRGAHEVRADPAGALPGVRPGDRPVVDEHAGRAPVPRAGAVRGTMGKPRLPRRRAQEHLVPQLRGGPAPRQDAEEPAGHDPGLMAAFQRGIGLAEARQSLRPDGPEQAPYPAADPLRRTPPAPAEPSGGPAAPGGHDASGPGHPSTARHDGSAPAG